MNPRTNGTWYEGENYHLFALRGIWYAVMLAETRGHSLQPAERNRLLRAFAAPFVTALPDFTMPSRKDSQYAVSLRQWRIAELTETTVSDLVRAPDAATAHAVELAALREELAETRELVNRIARSLEQLARPRSTQGFASTSQDS